MIVRIGPWVDPDSAEIHSSEPSRSNAIGNGQRSRTWRDRLAGLFKPQRKPPPRLQPDEEHRYRSTDCPITEALLDRLSGLTERPGSGHRTGVVDRLDRTCEPAQKLAEARSANNDWLTLRELGEIIVLLGQAARFHRKKSNAANVN